jgi:hypothetical protein
MVGDLNMKRFFPLLALTTALASVAAPAFALSVQAGEWENLQSGGHRKLVCLRHDRTFDEASVTKMSQGPGLKCVIDTFNASGDQVSFHATCTFAPGTASADATMTITSRDSYTSHTKAHMIKGLPLPSLDVIVTSRRLGDCKPGDTPAPE